MVVFYSEVKKIMLSTVARLLSPILNFSYVLRVRRNHGLEHGTIHVLNRQRYLLSGRAGGSGFVVVCQPKK
jgi:hypothetical protein